MKLIVNCDDLGYTRGVNEAIVIAYQQGILRSTTALVNSAYIQEAVTMMKENPGIGVGLHLNLTSGKPLTNCPSLTNPETGLFYKGRVEMLKHHPVMKEVESEWNAQMDRYIELFGELPDHIDSHHYVHDASPELLEVAKALAEKYSLPLRNHNHYVFTNAFYEMSKPKEFIEVVKKFEGQDVEIMVHVGIVDLDLYRWSSYNVQRIKELDILCSDTVKQYIEEHHIELTNDSE